MISACVFGLLGEREEEAIAATAIAYRDYDLNGKTLEGWVWATVGLPPAPLASCTATIASTTSFW